MKIIFSKNAWEDYTSWLTQDRKMLRKINDLIKDIQRTPFSGKGKPEPLKYDLAGLGQDESIENIDWYTKCKMKNCSFMRVNITTTNRYAP